MSQAATSELSLKLFRIQICKLHRLIMHLEIIADRATAKVVPCIVVGGLN